VILYLDTSALVKLYVEETGSVLVRHSVGEAEAVASSSIAYVELRAALARRQRERTLSTHEHRRIVKALDKDWLELLAIEVHDSLIKTAGAVAQRYALRAYDALHLASCLLLQNQLGHAVTFACWDANLTGAAEKAGLTVLPT
jgi:uncharacterized protein